MNACFFFHGGDGLDNEDIKQESELMPSLVNKCEHCIFSRRDSGVAWKAMGTWRSMSQVYWRFSILVMKSSRQIPLEKQELPYSEVFLVAIYLIFFLSFFFKLRYRWSTILCFSTWRFLAKDTGMGSHSFLPGYCSDPGIKPGSPALQADSLPTIWATREPWLQVYSKVIQLYILF